MLLEKFSEATAQCMESHETCVVQLEAIFRGIWPYTARITNLIHIPVWKTVHSQHFHVNISDSSV